LDSLVALTEWPVSDLLRELTWLEMQGFVQRVDGGYIRS
jgi:predicted Rossmann fold nucleotide-binding protein DprA/Smf involved in DNA uptake